MNYTKGEWKWEWEGGQPTIRKRDGFNLIATVYPKVGRRLFAPKGEAEANARLIATAPELYEALQSWDKLRAMHPLDSGDDIDAIFWECCEITDKAIDKAEGK